MARQGMRARRGTARALAALIRPGSVQVPLILAPVDRLLEDFRPAVVCFEDSPQGELVRFGFRVGGNQLRPEFSDRPQLLRRFLGLGGGRRDSISNFVKRFGPLGVDEQWRPRTCEYRRMEGDVVWESLGDPVSAYVEAAKVFKAVIELDQAMTRLDSRRSEKAVAVVRPPSGLGSGPDLGRQPSRELCGQELRSSVQVVCRFWSRLGRQNEGRKWDRAFESVDPGLVLIPPSTGSVERARMMAEVEAERIAGARQLLADVVTEWLQDSHVEVRFSERRGFEARWTGAVKTALGFALAETLNSWALYASCDNCGQPVTHKRRSKRTQRVWCRRAECLRRKNQLAVAKHRDRQVAGKGRFGRLAPSRARGLVDLGSP